MQFCCIFIGVRGWGSGAANLAGKIFFGQTSCNIQAVDICKAEAYRRRWVCTISKLPYARNLANWMSWKSL